MGTVGLNLVLETWFWSPDFGRDRHRPSEAEMRDESVIGSSQITSSEVSGFVQNFCKVKRLKSITLLRLPPCVCSVLCMYFPACILRVVYSPAGGAIHPASIFVTVGQKPTYHSGQLGGGNPSSNCGTIVTRPVHLPSNRHS